MENQLKETIQQSVNKTNLNLSLPSKQKVEEALVNLLVKKQSPQQAFEITDDMMEQFYKQGYNLFKAGKYAEAVKIFDSLRYLNLGDVRYSLAMGACYHYLKDYEKAASNYIISKEFDTENPTPCFHLYDCYIKLNQPLLAVDALAEVIVKSQNLPEYKTMHEKALLEKENLTTRLKSWAENNG